MKKLTRLTNTTGNSSKEYNVEISGNDSDGFVVNFSYGKIGQALKSGTKTNEPVSLESADKIAEKLIKAKMKKGYVADEDSSSGHIPVQSKADTVKFIPQLSNPVTMPEMRDLMRQKKYAVQCKYDGERGVMHIENEQVSATNRRGVTTSINPAFIEPLLKLANGKKAMLDCEVFSNHLRVFDVICIDGVDISEQPFFYRAVELTKLANFHQSSLLRFVDTVMINDFSHLENFLSKNREAGEEGIIIRELSAPYTPSRPNKLGSSLKIKNINDASCLVIKQEGDKRSVQLGLLNENDELIHVGNVTVPVNATIPKPKDVVDVEYLWVQGDGGKLIQPVWKRNRSNEILPDACRLSQVVYKNPQSSAEAV